MNPAALLPAEVTHYEYDFDTRTLLATSTLHLRLKAPGQSCVALANRTRLRTATWNGVPAEACAAAAGQTIFCGPEVSGHELLLTTTQELPQDTVIGPHAGFAMVPEPDGSHFTYLSSWIEECGRLGPCDPRTNSLSAFTTTVHHDPGETTLCAGAMTTSPTQTRCVIRQPLAPTYSALAVLVRSGWNRSTVATAAGTQVVLYEKSGGTLAAALAENQASVTAFLSWIQKLLGPLPYGDELRVVSAPTSWLGFEHPANLVLRQDLAEQRIEYPNPVLHTFMHEVVHQWAGNRTTLNERLDFVWKEALAEYLAYVFEDEFRPADEATRTRTLWEQHSISTELFPRPLVAPELPLIVLAFNTYGPGPMLLLLQLEALVGRAVILRAVQDFLGQPGLRSVADWQQALERAAGTSLADYFSAWVFGVGEPEWPSFVVTASQQASVVTVVATQRAAAASPFPSVLEVRLNGSQTTALLSLRFSAATGWIQTGSANLSEPLLGFDIDPRHVLVNRKNRE